MELVDDNCMLESNFHDDSDTLYDLNNLPAENLSSVFEIPHHSLDSSMCRSFENFNLLDDAKSLDDVSDNASSTMGNEFEVLLHDYSSIKKCLQTECCQRSDCEIGKLSQLLESIDEFKYLNTNEMEMVCQYARLLTINEINTKIVKKFSTVEKWIFVLSGSLKLEGDNNSTILIPGNYFGTMLNSPDILTEECNVYTNSEHCDLLVIGKEDLIPSQDLMIKTNDEDRTVIAVYEAVSSKTDHLENLVYILSKGTPEILINLLLTNQRWIHREFIEDFFMTQKIFSPSTNFIMEKIIKGLNEDCSESKEKFDIFIRWLSQNFKEFEKDEVKTKFIEEVAETLVNQKNQEDLYSLYSLYSNRASLRFVKSKLSFKDNIVPVYRHSNQMIFYIHNISRDNKLLNNGDIIVTIDDFPYFTITKELLSTFCDDNKVISLIVRNDPLGYHENVVKDLISDSYSTNSTPSNSIYARCNSDKISDTISISTNDSDILPQIESSPNIKKRPSLIPSIFSSIQNGTVGRFFKNPKYQSKTLVPSNRSISDVTTMDINTSFQRSNMSGSTISVARYSRRLKHNRKSAGSNPEIIKSFEDKDVGDYDILSFQKTEFPIRIYFKDIFIYRPDLLHNSSNKNELRSIHVMIKPSMSVTEVIILALVKLNLTSMSSKEYFLVEVKVDDTNMMIHEKILKPTLINLKLKVQSKFYLKHTSFIGSSLILQKESEKMITEFQLFSLLKLSMNELVIELFIRSHRIISNLSPTDLISYVTNSKATLKIHKQSNQSEKEFDKYIQLSDFYKNWVTTEICSEQMCPIKRSKIIQYFIWLAYKAQLIGHIDLFFSLISGLDSTEISRLTLSWDKVSSRDKKLFRNLKKILNVSNNMRYLRDLQQKISAPFIPVTAIVVKDLTMIEETNPTFVKGTINGLQVNQNLINFDKMRKMAKLSRTFINSICICDRDNSKPILRHRDDCTSKLENEERLRRSLYRKMDESNPIIDIEYSLNFDRKHSVSNASVKSSSSESISHPTSPVKTNPDFGIIQAFNVQHENLWIDFYLSKLDNIIINDPAKLSEISLVCEPNMQYGQNTLKMKLAKSQKQQDDLIFNHNHFSPSAVESNISDKAAEILGIKAKSAIHKYKKCGES